MSTDAMDYTCLEQKPVNKLRCRYAVARHGSRRHGLDVQCVSLTNDMKLMKW
jgi:hypothetical protein